MVRPKPMKYEGRGCKTESAVPRSVTEGLPVVVRTVQRQPDGREGGEGVGAQRHRRQNECPLVKESELVCRGGPLVRYREYQSEPVRAGRTSGLGRS